MNILNLGADGTFSLPATINQNLGSLTLMKVVSSTLGGTFEFSSRVIDAATGMQMTSTSTHSLCSRMNQKMSLLTNWYRIAASL